MPVHDLSNSRADHQFALHRSSLALAATIPRMRSVATGPATPAVPATRKRDRSVPQADLGPAHAGVRPLGASADTMWVCIHALEAHERQRAQVMRRGRVGVTCSANVEYACDIGQRHFESNHFTCEPSSAFSEEAARQLIGDLTEDWEVDVVSGLLGLDGSVVRANMRIVAVEIQFIFPDCVGRFDRSILSMNIEPILGPARSPSRTGPAVFLGPASPTPIRRACFQSVEFSGCHLRDDRHGEERTTTRVRAGSGIDRVG